MLAFETVNGWIRTEAMCPWICLKPGDSMWLRGGSVLGLKRSVLSLCTQFINISSSFIPHYNTIKHATKTLKMQSCIILFKQI